MEENKYYSVRLKNAIQILEHDKLIKGYALKEQLLLVHESLKPANLIKSVISEVSTSPYLIDNLLGSTVGLATGYISRKIAVGSSGNVVKKLLGVVLQFGVTNVVAQHIDAIKLIGQSIFQHFKHKNEMNTENE